MTFASCRCWAGAGAHLQMMHAMYLSAPFVALSPCFSLPLSLPSGLRGRVSSICFVLPGLFELPCRHVPSYRTPCHPAPQFERERSRALSKELRAARDRWSATEAERLAAEDARRWAGGQRCRSSQCCSRLSVTLNTGQEAELAREELAQPAIVSLHRHAAAGFRRQQPRRGRRLSGRRRSSGGTRRWVGTGHGQQGGGKDAMRAV